MDEIAVEHYLKKIVNYILCKLYQYKYFYSKTNHLLVKNKSFINERLF